ncbi:RNA-directed DNA polymerase, eukaryota, reverse transcriptase zinc-binding domain protein [Tanacetum coccineum]|uniref:RNA-directed DNA polymerase, eukaryota, reverse transcriptase zinc-binding domain protein n=1 Tax=Tanacetum coccineum TaxID=301880 RepID=A0ABQ5DAR1_9ASTR
MWVFADLLFGFPIKCHEKFRILKAKIRQWNNNKKTMERNRKSAALEELSSIEKKIDEGSASTSDTENRLNLFHELEIIDKFASMDLIQKAQIKWDIEGDENTKFFNGLINQKRRNQMINGIMVEGNWIYRSSLMPSSDAGVMVLIVINIHKSNIYDIRVNEDGVYNVDSNAGCIAVVKAFHGHEGGFDNNGCSFKGTWANIVGSSNFLHSKGIILNNSFRFNAGCGTRIRWKDIWVGEGPLFISEDTCVWNLCPNGTFTVKDARNIIDQKTLPSLPSTSWDKIIPRKVNIFMWRLSLDRLPHRLNLSLRGMDIPAISCSSCNANVESANHIFFECIIASDL